MLKILQAVVGTVGATLLAIAALEMRSFRHYLSETRRELKNEVERERMHARNS